jgi:single-strand DNA-binding protein
VIFWRRLAERVEKYVHKGDKIFIDGKIQSRTYQDQQGMQRHVTEIMAENLEILVRKSDSLRREEQNNSPTQPSEPEPIDYSDSPEETDPF